MRVYTEIYHDINNSPPYLIKIILSSKEDYNQEKSNKDFLDFINLWKEYYDSQKEFCFIFDTQNLSKAPISFCYRLVKFINEIKKNQKQYLKFSIINVTNGFVKYLYKLLFTLTKPVAPVYIVKNLQESTQLYEYKIKNNSMLNYYIKMNDIAILNS